MQVCVHPHGTTVAHGRHTKFWCSFSMTIQNKIEGDVRRRRRAELSKCRLMALCTLCIQRSVYILDRLNRIAYALTRDHIV